MRSAFALLFSEEEWTVILLALQSFSIQADLKTQLDIHRKADKIKARIQKELMPAPREERR